MTKCKAQIAIEFLLLTSFSLVFLLILLLILSKIATDNSEYMLQSSIQDFGISLKNEITTASEMENGYIREIELPKKLSGKEYTITIDESLSGNSYIIVKSELNEMYFNIPKTTGTMGPGNNIISKQGNITVTHTS